MGMRQTIYLGPDHHHNMPMNGVYQKASGPALFLNHVGLPDHEQVVEWFPWV